MYLCVSGIYFVSFHDCSIICEMFRQCAIFCFSVRFVKCSDSVLFFVFLLDLWNVPTVCYFLFFCYICEMFGQCAIFCFSVRFVKCSDSVISLNKETKPNKFKSFNCYMMWLVLSVIVITTLFVIKHKNNHYKCLKWIISAGSESQMDNIV
jgi:hypothetical protein